MNTQTDRENLELAAKAAEIVVLGYVEYYDEFYWNGPSWGLIVDEVNGVWNPLDDDGDALRLAAKLGIDVEWRSDGRVAAYRHANANGYCFTALVLCQEDRAASVRRAIVRAAAADTGKNGVRYEHVVQLNSTWAPTGALSCSF